MLHRAQRAVALPQPFALQLQTVLRRLPRHRLLGLRRRALRRRRRRERRLQLLLELEHLPPLADGDTHAAGGVGIAIGEGWQVLQLQQELQAALAAAAAAQRAAAEAEEAVARQAAQHSLELQRERLRERHRALSPVKHSNL